MKELTEYNKDNQAKDGYKRNCRVCTREMHAAWRADNPDAIRVYNARNNPRRSREYISADNTSAQGIARKMRGHHGYPPEEALAVAKMLLDDETRCSICGMPNWLIKLNHKKGGPFFLGTRNQNARMHPDRIDTTQPHTRANTRPCCPTCNMKRGAERHTDVEVLRWISRRWQDIFSPRFLWWLNTTPGQGGRARRNPAAKGVPGVMPNPASIVPPTNTSS